MSYFTANAWTDHVILNKLDRNFCLISKNFLSVGVNASTSIIYIIHFVLDNRLTSTNSPVGPPSEAPELAINTKGLFGS